MPTEHFAGDGDHQDRPDRDTTNLQDDAAALRQERDELRDKYLRGVAEFDNYRRRTERERREFAEAAAADLLRDLLPIVDDFERALANAEPPGDRASEAYHRGVELIHRQLLDTLRKHGAEPFDSVGDDFDPSRHEAVAQEPANGHRDGEVTGELRRGYFLRSRLLRPAQVKVAKA
jgi:molecular chaperone GrpE